MHWPLRFSQIAVKTRTAKIRPQTGRNKEENETRTRKAQFHTRFGQSPLSCRPQLESSKSTLEHSINSILRCCS